jgi:ABC-2 type transport system permease protein
VSARRTLATAGRVLRQIRHDPRTIALVLVVPPLLLALMDALLDGRPQAFQHVGPPLVGLFPFIVMFLVTSIAMLRERTTGTLERLMTLPLAKLDLLAGYGLAFGVLACAQATVAAAVAFGLLGLDASHGVLLVTVLAVANALLGMALGLFVSAFARTEFQAVQFMPALVMPQLLVCGLFVERSQMADWLQSVSQALPLTYAYDALARAVSPGQLGADFAFDVVVVVVVAVLALALGAATLRRSTA